MHLDRTILESLEQYVGFTAEDLERLRAFAALAEPHLSAVADDFYAAIAAHEDTRDAITGGQPQIDRLKRTLVQWMHDMLTRARDAEYLEKNARIGRVHVRINLPQHYMFTAMNRIRSRLLTIAFEELPTEELPQVALALDRAVDLELAIMLDTYRGDMDRKVRGSARLATIGQLAASIGHELRNPLGVIGSSAFLLRNSSREDDEGEALFEKHVQRIEEQVALCTRTIDNLLDLARDRPPKIARHRLLDSVHNGVEQSGVEPRGAVNLDIPPELLVDADPTDLAHVISNLALNAWQAQGSDPKLWIAAREAPGGVAIVLQDSGPGIRPEDRQRVFDALYTTKARGTGLGLALCRRVLDAHQGEIEVLDCSDGAKFRLWLPTRDVTDG